MIEEIASSDAASRGANNKFKELTIEQFCAAPFIATGDDSAKSLFTKRCKLFKLSSKKQAMIKVRAYTLRNEIDKLSDFLSKLNKKSEQIPFDIVFEFLENMSRKDVYHSNYYHRLPLR